MKNKLKKLLSKILIIAICVNSVNISAFADDTSQRKWDGVSTQSIYEAEDYNVLYTLTGYWDGGYNASIKIENTGDTVIENWYLGFDTNSNICSIWNGKIETKEYGQYIIKNAE